MLHSKSGCYLLLKEGKDSLEICFWTITADLYLTIAESVSLLNLDPADKSNVIAFNLNPADKIQPLFLKFFRRLVFSSFHILLMQLLTFHPYY